jgi:putative PIN family toxin of toxin-antitoxin system
MPAKPSPLVFLDSNVIFSGLYSPDGPAGQILEYFITGRIRVAISQLVLEEVVRTLKGKLPEALPAFRILLLNTSLLIVRNPSARETTRWVKIIDTDDVTIIASAAAVKPDYLVTGDKHFFATKIVAEKSGLKIVTPAQFIQEFNRSSFT